MKKACGLLIGAVFGFIAAFSIIACSSTSVAAETSGTNDYSLGAAQNFGLSYTVNTVHDNINNQDYIVVYNRDGGIAITPRLPKETD